MEGVVSISPDWYVEIFGSQEEAADFASKHGLELIEPENEDGMPEVQPQGGRRR